MIHSYSSNSSIVAAHNKAVGGAPKRCTIGKSCSAACITRSDTCLVEIPASPSAAMSQFRDEVSGHTQHTLFDVKSYISSDSLKEHIKGRDAEIKKEILKAIDDDDKVAYNKHRDEAIQLNKKLVKEDLVDKGNLIKVPITWEKYKKIEEDYYHAANTLEKEMRIAATNNDEKEYNKLERRLMAMQEKLGKKIGDKELRKPGEIWDEHEDDRRKNPDINPFVKALKSDPKLADTDIDTSELGSGQIQVGRMIRGSVVLAKIWDFGTDDQELTFSVDGSYRRDPDMSDSKRRAIAIGTRSLFNSILKHMDDGEYLKVSAYDQDGGGKDREEAYAAYGFVKRGGYMYGVVQNGKIVSPF